MSLPKREWLPVLCCNLAYAYQACLCLAPSKVLEGPLDLRIIQVDTVAKPETRCRHLLLRMKYHLEDDLVDCGGKWTTFSVI